MWAHSLFPEDEQADKMGYLFLSVGDGGSGSVDDIYDNGQNPWVNCCVFLIRGEKMTKDIFHSWSQVYIENISHTILPKYILADYFI